MDSIDKQKVKLNNQELRKFAFSVLEKSQKKNYAAQGDNQNSDITDLLDYKIKDIKEVNNVKIMSKFQMNQNTDLLSNQEDKKNMNDNKEEAGHKEIMTPVIVKEKINNKQNEMKYNDEELLEAYIGNNYDKITKRFFNFSATIFGPLYYFYRKMYIIGFISILIFILILNFIKAPKLIMAILIIYEITLGVIFDPLYAKISKKKIENLKEKFKNGNVKEKCVLYGGTTILNTTLLSFGYFLIIILFFTSQAFNVLSQFISFSYANDKENEIYIKAENFKNMVESYAVTAKLNIENPGVYKYIINDLEYDFIALPVASDDKSIYCSKKSLESSWQNKDGFETKENSTSCDEFMNDILKNYSKFYNIEIPILGDLIISKDGKIMQDTELVFDDITCTYNSKIKNFQC